MRRLNWINIGIACFVFAFWFGVWMLATSCTSTKVVESGTGKTAILVEGLASYTAGFVRNNYKTELEELGYTVYSEPYTTNKPIKADVCIGHSFGGGAVINKFIFCKLLITMDPREWKASNNDNYVSPCIDNECQHYNFWEEKDLLRGYPVAGAINKKISSSHVALPGTIKSEILDIIKGVQ